MIMKNTAWSSHYMFSNQYAVPLTNHLLARSYHIRSHYRSPTPHVSPSKIITRNSHYTEPFITMPHQAHIEACTSSNLLSFLARFFLFFCTCPYAPISQTFSTPLRRSCELLCSFKYLLRSHTTRAISLFSNPR